MSSCPTEAQLERYLEGLPPDDARVAVHEHVGTCSTCQAWLQEARADEAIVGDVRRVMGSDETSPLADATARRSDRPSRGEPVPSDAIPGYEIVRELHRGGQGVVYQAVQEATKRKVAIKILLEGRYASRAATKRFEREIELVGQLKHPNIISIFHSGTTTDGRQFCVMDYVRGVPLTDYVRQHKPPLEEVLELFSTVCEAVNCAHQKGVIHRDLKPSNTLVDVDGNLKVLDFGLAKQMTEPVETLVSMTGQIVGTLPYASPEQTRGNPDEIDIRTDVYSLGVVLYELLTGHYPYPVVGQMADVLRHITETQPIPPSRCWTTDSGVTSRSSRMLRPGQCPIDGELQTIVLKALAKQRERRYQSAADLGRDIRRYLNREPIEARHDSGWYLLRTALRRYRVAFCVAAGFMAVVAASAIGLGVLYRRAESARAREMEQRQAAEAVVDFLTKDLLEATRPEKLGRDATVRAVLNGASENISGKFKNRPLIEAAVRTSLGKSYPILGDYDRMGVHLEEALKLYGANLGDEDPLTLDGMCLLAWAHKLNGQFEQAESLYLQTLRIARSALGEEDDRTLKFIGHLAALYQERGDSPKAEPLLVRLLDLTRRRHGVRHSETLGAEHNLGWFYLSQGRYQDAEPLFLESLEGYRSILGAKHPDTLTAMGNLAWTRYRLGNGEGAEALYAEALEIRREAQGEDHPDTLRCMSNLGEVQYRNSKHEAALQTLGQCDAFYAAHPEQRRPHVLAILTLAHHQLGHAEDAQAAFVRLDALVRNPRWQDDRQVRDLHIEAAAALGR